MRRETIIIEFSFLRFFFAFYLLIIIIKKKSYNIYCQYLFWSVRCEIVITSICIPTGCLTYLHRYMRNALLLFTHKMRRFWMESESETELHINKFNKIDRFLMNYFHCTLFTLHFLSTSLVFSVFYAYSFNASSGKIIKSKIY